VVAQEEIFVEQHMVVMEAELLVVQVLL